MDAMKDVRYKYYTNRWRFKIDIVRRVRSRETTESYCHKLSQKPQRNCHQHPERMANCEASKCLANRRSITPASHLSSCFDRCAQRGLACQTKRSKLSNTPLAMFTLSSAAVWCMLAISATSGVATTSPENLQIYPPRPKQQIQSLHQLSLEQSFHRPTRNSAPTTKVSSSSVGNPQQQHLNSQPHEQSRLAKLCQQTSNVLASVLPAPFGGLKRSILCQFFGQIPLKGLPEDEAPHASIAVMQHVVPHSGHPQVALPLPLSAKHPIELIIDQNRRDYLLSQQQQSMVDPLNGASVQDLGASSSILNYAFEKRLEVPKKIASSLKSSGYSVPFDHIFSPATISQVGSSPLMSTSGWRIFNQFDPTTSTEKPTTQKPLDTISTSTIASPPQSTTKQLNSTSINDRSTKLKTDLSTTPSDVSKDEKVSLLVIGKPPAPLNQHQQQHQSAVTKPESSTTTTKRMESTKFSTTHATSTNPTPLEPLVRTIEVNAQITNPSAIILAPLVSQHNNGSNSDLNSAKNSTKIAASRSDLNQVRLREELVIASINNLTRIAFGNHLRDTVKVINKLIDQQSDLFSNVASGSHKDSMVPAESKNQPGLVPKPSSKSAPAVNSSTTVNSTNRKSASKHGKPTKSRFLKQASLQHQLSTSTMTKSTAREPTGSAFSFPELDDDWRRISRAKSGSSPKSNQAPMKSRATIIGEMQQDKSLWLVSSSRQSTASTAASTSFHSWLTPDRSFTVSTAEDASLDLARKWDSKKQQAPSKQPSRLVLNRLNKDKSAKRDSLTTLKSFLTTTPPHGTTLSAASQITSAQSRWMPTVILPGTLHPKFTANSKSSSRLVSSTTPPPSTTTTVRPSSPTSTTNSANVTSTEPTTKANLLSSTKADQPSVTFEAQTSSEATYEARASDSINRYTTHLNDANELLATTRRFSPHSHPQTAQTGEFFNADTIATWPERYQTRIGQAMEGSTVSMGDTTRRSGETYQSTSLARHRMDAGSTATTLSLAPPTTLDISSRMTTLPANHKLTTQLDLKSTTASLPLQTYPVSSTNRMITSYSTPSPYSVAYTLIGPYTQGESEQENGTNDEFPLVSADNPSHSLSIYIQQPLNGSGAASPLRPPYADQHSVLDQPQSIDDSDAVALKDREQHLNNRTYTQQRLLEMLSPWFTTDDSGPAINQQRSNLSALKYLTRNLFTGRPNKKGLDQHLSMLNESTTWQDHQLASELDNSHRNLSSLKQVRSLFDFLDDVSLMSQTQANQYDSASLNSSESGVDFSTNGFNNGSKSIFGRAGNLLSDLRQLEQKRAAAILAAIRYQVPSPLVKPWEMAASFYHLGAANSNLPSRISSRSDRESSSVDQDYLVDDLLLNKLIRMALRKQRVVPRSVLEERLKQSADRGDHDVVLDRRLDSIEDTDQLVAHKPIESKIAELEDSSKSDMLGISMNTATKRLVNKILNRRTSNDRQDYSIGDSNYGLDDISKLDNIRLQQADAAVKSERPIAESSRVNPVEESPQDKKIIREEVKGNFECANRSAGFYPDAATTCRTFYHCSSTGHLLTFNCPQQSRFDEKSLKCGPWYEVPCDLRRIS